MAKLPNPKKKLLFTIAPPDPPMTAEQWQLVKDRVAEAIKDVLVELTDESNYSAFMAEKRLSPGRGG